MKRIFKIILASFVALGVLFNSNAKEMDACELADQFLDIDKAVALCLAPPITNERVIILFNWILEDDWGNGDIDLYLDTLDTVKKAIKVDEYLRIKAKIYSIFKNQNETYKKKSLDLYKQAADLGNADAASTQLKYGPSLTASERIS